MPFGDSSHTFFLIRYLKINVSELNAVVSEPLNEKELQELANTLDLDNSDIEDDLLTRHDDLDEELEQDLEREILPPEDDVPLPILFQHHPKNGCVINSLIIRISQIQKIMWVVDNALRVFSKIYRQWLFCKRSYVEKYETSKRYDGTFIGDFCDREKKTLWLYNAH